MTIQIFFQPLRPTDTSPIGSATPRSIAGHGRGGVKSNSLSHVHPAMLRGTAGGERDMHHSVPVIEGIIPSLLTVSRSITGYSALAI